MTPPGFLSRDQVRDRLELTEREIRKLVAHKVLRADRVNSANWALYSEAQVQTLENRKHDGSLFVFNVDKTLTRPAGADVNAYRAEDGVRVFELIEERTPLPKIAVLTRLHPRIIDQIRYDYDQLSGSMTIPKELLDQMNALRRLPGSFPLRSPTDVLEVLQLADAERMCPTCQKHSSAVECPGCIAGRAVNELMKGRGGDSEESPPAHANGSRSRASGRRDAIMNAPDKGD